ncbi:MAG: hypothetical protein U0V74_15495 [Chitinophagales bacterium]
MRLLIAAACSLLVLYSCNTPAKLLCRNWQVNDVKFTPTGVLNQAEREQLHYKLTREFRFQFRKDSTYVTIQNYDSLPGKWWLSADKKQIVTVTNTDTTTAQIITLNHKVFAFRPLNTLNTIDQLICYPAATK